MVKELETLEKKLKKIKIKKIPNTFLSIIYKNFDEVTISKYLAFLLNPENTNIKVLESLLKISKINEDETNFNELLANEDTVFESIDVEDAISTRSRIDILIRFSTFDIVIENKINSMENNEQSIKYEKDLDKNDRPIKYICIKPQYNMTLMKNKKFAHITYNQIIEILKSITKYDLEEQENYQFIEDFIKHVEVYFMKENQLQIGDDVELYIENQKIIDTMIENYRKQCDLVISRLEELIKEKFGEQYNIYNSPKYGFLQIWKKDWINDNHNGIHYEILWDAKKLISSETKIRFAIHNEKGTKNQFPEINHCIIKTETYKFDSADDIIQSLINIVDEIDKIAKENNTYIDEVFIQHKK